MKKIDAHCHFDPGHIQPDEQPYISGNGLDYTEQGLLRDMTRVGISRSLLISTRIGRNEAVAALSRKYPDRFSAVATLRGGSRNLRGSIQSVARGLREKNFVGLKFYLGYEPIVAHSLKWDPVYRLAIKFDVPVIFHTGDTLGSRAYLKYSHPLLVDQIAVKYPNLKIVIAHLGNPWVMDAAEVVYKNPNVYADLSAFYVGRERPDKYMRQRINQALAYCGTKKIIFGTDYPLVRQGDYCRFVESLDLTVEQLKGIYYETAAKLFKL